MDKDRTMEEKYKTEGEKQMAALYQKLMIVTFILSKKMYEEMEKIAPK